MFKIDLQDVYFHVSINQGSRKYLCFAFESKVYQFLVLLFSLNTAPQVFTRLGHTVAGYLHHPRILVIPYFDNWLAAKVSGHGRFQVKRKKSELDQVQAIQFLEIHLDFDQGILL